MSADNTIGILVNRRRDGQEGQEYRVAEAQAIENIYYEADYPSADRKVFNREWVRELFSKAPFFHQMENANRYAQRMLRRIEGAGGIVEYGVRIFDHSDTYFPASDRKRLRRRFGRLQQQERYDQEQEAELDRGMAAYIHSGPQ